MAVVLDFFEYKFFKRIVPVKAGVFQLEKITQQVQQDRFMQYLEADLAEIMKIKNEEEIIIDPTDI